MERYELPNGWEWRRLGDRDYFDLIMGQSPPSHTYNMNGEGLPFFQGKAEFGDLHPIARKYCSSPIRVAMKDDVLISVRAPVGPTNLADRECCIGRGLAAIRCKRSVLPRYLLYSLRNIESEIAAMVRNQGGGFTAIKRKQLSCIEIPLPPLSKQRRIIAWIEEIAHHVEEARRLQKEALEKADSLLPAALSQVFSDGQSWPIRSVSEVCEKPQYGYTESATSQAIGPKFLRITDIQNGHVDWQAVPYCKCAGINKYRLRSGDILFARTGSTTGKSYLVGDCPEAIFASYLIRLRTKSDVSPDFLWWHFQSPNYWTQVFSGVEVGAQPNMNGKKLAAVKVPVPSASEQRSIVAYLDTARSKVEELKSQQQATQDELNKVIPSMLSKAFSGEL